MQNRTDQKTRYLISCPDLSVTWESKFSNMSWRLLYFVFWSKTSGVKFWNGIAAVFYLPLVALR